MGPAFAFVSWLIVLLFVVLGGFVIWLSTRTAGVSRTDRQVAWLLALVDVGAAVVNILDVYTTKDRPVDGFLLLWGGLVILLIDHVRPNYGSLD